MKSRIAITTCRNPTRGIRSLANDLAAAIPNAYRVTRGKQSLGDLSVAFYTSKADRAIFVQRWRGEPGKIELKTMVGQELNTLPPVIHLAGVRFKREYGESRRVKAEAITIEPNVATELLEFAEKLAEFLGLPILRNRGNIPCNASLHISKHPSHKAKLALTKPPGIREVGPSLVVKDLVWEKVSCEEGNSRIIRGIPIQGSC